MINKLVFSFLLTLISLISFNINYSYAARLDDPFTKACEGVSDSTLCQENQSNQDPVSGTNALIPRIANIIAAIGGIIAVAIIMISGLKFITSSGDSKKLSEARNTIIYASVGLLVIALSRIIIQFILNLI